MAEWRVLVPFSSGQMQQSPFCGAGSSHMEPAALAYGGDRMASPKGERALAIRDHALPLIRKRGSLQRLNDVSIVTWGARALRFALRMPFSSWPKERPAPSYQHALAGQQASALPCALEGQGLEPLAPVCS